MLLKLRSNCSLALKNQYWRGEIGGKKNLLYSGGGQLGEKADSCLIVYSPLTTRGHKLLKGISRVYKWREGATCRNSTVRSDSHLEIGHWWPDQHPPDCVEDS